MIFLPLVGGFVVLALWGSLFHVPGNDGPHGRYVRTISDTVGAAAVALGICDLAEVIFPAYTVLPGHKDGVYVHGTGFPSPVDHVGFPTVTGTRKAAISVGIPLWEEAILLQICMDIGPVDYNMEASDSPASSSRAGKASAWGFLAFVALLLKGLLVTSGASKLGDKLGELGRSLEGTPKVAHCLVADGAPSLYEEMDALVEGKMPSQVVVSGATGGSLTRSSTAAPLEQQAWDVASILPEVEKAILRLERQRLVAVFADLGFRTEKGVKVNPNGVVDGLTDIAQGASDVVGSSALHLPREWALVVRRPENLSPVMVYQLVCALLAGWERHTASAVPVVPGSQVAEEPENNGAEGAPTSGGRRRKRPSQAKRKRFARRNREREEGLNEAVAAEAPPSSSARPTDCDPPAPTQSQGPLIVGNRVPSHDARHGQFSGPPPAPASDMGAYPSPYGWQPMYSQPPPYYYYGPY